VNASDGVTIRLGKPRREVNVGGIAAGFGHGGDGAGGTLFGLDGTTGLHQLS
jgi:hypothetical protein